MSSPPKDRELVAAERPVTFMRRFAAATVGLLAGALVVLTVFLIKAVVDEGRDAAKIKLLAEANEQRLAQQASGVREGLDILCKLKKYDLTTGLPALKARRERGSVEYDPARAQVLERALLLVLSIPSSPTCLASAANITPKHAKPRKPSTGRGLLRELEHTGLAPSPAPVPTSPGSNAPRIEREGTARGRAGPRGPRGPAGGSSPPRTTTVTTTTPAPAPAATTPNSTPPGKEREPGPPATPPGKEPERIPPGKEEPPVKAHGKLCVELLKVVTVGC